MTYSYIDSDKLLIGFRKKLSMNNIKAVCMDFEAEFNLHCYGEKLCLIQIFDGKVYYIIDPFQISKNELKKILESNVIKLFYGAGSDRKLVFNQYGIRIKSLLDIAELVEVINLPYKSLSSVIEHVLSISIEKKKKFQKHNWTLRPIAEDAIQYALSDVKYLFDLKDELLKRIKDRNLLEPLVYRLANAEFDYEKKSEPGVKKKYRYQKYSQKQKIIFDIVFEIREINAKKLDKPPNSVITNEQIYQIAENGLTVANINFGKTVQVETRKRMLKEISETLSTVSTN